MATRHVRSLETRAAALAVRRGCRGAGSADNHRRLECPFRALTRAPFLRDRAFTQSSGPLILGSCDKHLLSLVKRLSSGPKKGSRTRGWMPSAQPEDLRSCFRPCLGCSPSPHPSLNGVDCPREANSYDGSRCLAYGTLDVGMSPSGRRPSARSTTVTSHPDTAGEHGCRQASDAAGRQWHGHALQGQVAGTLLGRRTRRCVSPIPGLGGLPIAGTGA
jgi:hypothetical protein